MHPWYVGILIDEDLLSDDLDRLPCTEVIETVSEEYARAIIAFWYMRQHLVETVAYQRLPIGMDLPLNIMMPVASILWFKNSVQKQYGMAPILQAIATLNLDMPSNKELFEGLEENELPETTRIIVCQNGNPAIGKDTAVDDIAI